MRYKNPETQGLWNLINSGVLLNISYAYWMSRTVVMHFWTERDPKVNGSWTKFARERRCQWTYEQEPAVAKERPVLFEIMIGALTSEMNGCIAIHFSWLKNIQPLILCILTTKLRHRFLSLSKAGECESRFAKKISSGMGKRCVRNWEWRKIGRQEVPASEVGIEKPEEDQPEKRKSG